MDLQEGSDILNNLNEDQLIEKFTASSKGWKIAGVVLCVAGVLPALGTAAVTIYDVYKYYHQDMVPIPRKIVHESSDDKGRSVYTVYDVTLCNRQAQGFNKEQTGDYGDMNGDVGKQWLALYTTKDKAAGDPITADIIAQKGTNKMPADKSTGIRLFGKTDMVNIVSEEYGCNDKLIGSVVGTGVMVGSCVGSAALGALICVLLVRRKKGDNFAA